MKFEKTSSGYSVQTECKNYAFNESSPLISQITANGKELFAAPARVVCRNGDNTFCVANAEFRRAANGEGLILSSSAQSGLTVVDAVTTVEEDGLLDVTLSIMPSGLAGLEALGMIGDMRKNHFFRLDGVYLEFPLKKDWAKFAHLFPIGNFNKDGESVGNDSLRIADYLPEKEIYCGFKNQVLVLGDDCGFGIFFEQDREFVYGKEKKVFEIINGENEYILRVRLIDALPEKWVVPEAYLNDPENWTLHFFPITFRFGLQALPVRKWSYAGAFERNLHTTCFGNPQNYDESDPGSNYDDFMWLPMDGQTESRLDRIKRLGVKVLYIHENWNDYQNSPILSEDTANRLKRLIAACHERGIKLVPYFGYEISTLSPLFAKYGKKFVRVNDTKDMSWHWYRYPYQRDLSVCLNSEWNDIFFEGLTALQAEFGFDGFYLDGTVCPFICKNEEHGCGFYKDGELHGTYAVFAQREFIKKLYAYATEHDLIINVHPGGAINLATIAYCTSVWDGEFFQTPLLNGKLTEAPEPLIRTQYSGKNTGVPMFALCYSNPPVWRFRQAAGLALLYGALPKTGDFGEGLEIMSRIWDIFEEYMTKNADFHAYYENCENSPVSLSGDDHIKLSYFENEKSVLAIVCCIKKGVEESAELSSNYAKIINAENGEVASENGKLTLKFNDFDFKILKINK